MSVSTTMKLDTLQIKADAPLLSSNVGQGSHNPATHPVYKHKCTHLLMAVSDNEYFLQGEIDGCPLLLRRGVERCEAVGQNDHG